MKFNFYFGQILLCVLIKDDKISLPYDSNVVRHRSLVVNLYLLDIERSHNEILQIESQGTSVYVMSLNKNLEACVGENSWTLDISDFEVSI